MKPARLALTPAERAEVLCLALGVPCEVSAAARGVSPGTIRARRRRLAGKLGSLLAGVIPPRAGRSRPARPPHVEDGGTALRGVPGAREIAP